MNLPEALDAIRLALAKTQSTFGVLDRTGCADGLDHALDASKSLRALRDTLARQVKADE